MIDLAEVSEEELLERTGLTLRQHQEIQAWMGRETARARIRLLRGGIVSLPMDYDYEGVIEKCLDEWGMEVQDLSALRAGFFLGLCEGYKVGAKKACDAFEVLRCTSYE